MKRYNKWPIERGFFSFSSFLCSHIQGTIDLNEEPENYNGKSIDWKDYIVHFEQTARWNSWTDCEKNQQLSMSLRGAA